MKFFKNKLAVTVIVLSVTFLGIIIYSVKSDSGNFVSNGIGTTLNPVQKLVYKVGDKFNGTIDFFSNFSRVKLENEELKKKNIELENKLIEYDNFKRENEELRSVLDFTKERDQYNYVGVNIIRKSSGEFFDGYIIDKGEKDGIRKDMVVISQDGLVGLVTESNSNWSKVQSLVNENIAVSAMVQSTRESTGIVKGYRDANNSLLAKLYNLPITSDVKEGDVIVTSGLGKFYPKDIRIGEVISVEEDNVKVMKNAVIKPYVDFNKLEELFVIVPKNIRDTDEITY